MPDLVGHLSAVDRASLFDALEQAATRVGLALFVVHVDADPPTIIYASELFAQLVGRPVSEIVGKPPWAVIAPAQRARVAEIIASRGPGAPPITLAEFEVERPNGARRAIEVGVSRITTSGAELAVCYLRDTTEQRTAQAALRRSEARFRSLIEHAPDGVVLLQAGRIMLANAAAVRMFGVTDSAQVHGRMLSEFVPPEEMARAMERMNRVSEGAEMGASDYRLLHEDRVVEVHSVACEYDDKPAILTFVRDATERRRMQEQLFHADRLAALGTMAATVAHEINNPLTYVQLNLQRLDREAATEPDPARAALLREHLFNALHGVERVARIVRDLQVYSRGPGNDAPEAPAPVDAVAIVERALHMVEHDLRHRAQLVRRYPDEPAIVDGNASRLEQVVINLLVNALQALDAKRPQANRITVEIDIEPETIQIAVSDTGLGVPDPERIFEPFFTTKSTQQGTGLGLFVCKQIVERMRGRIAVVSTGVRGTKLAVTLPRRSAPLPQPAAESVRAPAADRLRVLVIDDEPHVRRAIRNVLASEHDVEVVGDGEAALAMLATAQYDVILCDLMMPQLTGRDVYEQIRARWPGVERRIVFITGGAFVPALAAFLDSVDNLTLLKPFTIEGIREIVRQARQGS